MYFLFHLWNHTPAGQRSLEDVIGIIGHQLRGLGHGAIWDPNNDPNSAEGKGKDLHFAIGPGQWNVIVEGFTPQVIDVIKSAYNTLGARFLCLATEEPTDKGFNHGTTREMAWRQETFIPAMKYFDGILHLVPGKRVTDWFSAYAPTSYVELGYAPTFIRRDLVPNPPHEVAFYGSITKRRLNLLKKVAKRIGRPNSVAVIADFRGQQDRDRAIQHAKIVLQLRKFDEMGLVSSSRCNTSLSCGRPVLAEPHDLTLSKPWDQIVKFAATEDDFFTDLFLMLPRWRDAHHFQFERFKKMLTPEVCIGHALHKIGIIDHELGYSPERAAA